MAYRHAHIGRDRGQVVKRPRSRRLNDRPGSRHRPLVGALSLGEIDTMPELGIPRFHNATLVCLSAL